MRMNRKVLASLLAGAAAVVLLGAADCDDPQDKGAKERNDKVAGVTLCGKQGEGTECRNLKKKLDRDNDPNRITYLYELSWTGEFIGYYTVKGKVSSNQSQMGPMDIGVRVCPTDWTTYHDGCYQLGEAPGDDGSYGPNEDGIFFFTTDDVKITWNGLYQQSDRPLSIKVPQLYEATK